VVHWDGDGRKDLLVGRADGLVTLFLNVGTDDAPHFDGGSPVQVGAPEAKSDLDVGARATPRTIDWDGDGRKDLVVGAYDGRLRLYLNEGTDDAPDFHTEQIIQAAGVDLVVPTLRSSPDVVDLTHDGRKDVLVGNTEGQLLLYENTGTNELPDFSGHTEITADGAPLDLPSSARSRPFVCHWGSDGVPDVLIGAGDGLVRFYSGTDVLTGVSPTGAVAAATLRAPRPNPFRPATTVPFGLDGPRRARLTVHDVTGRRIATLVDRALGAGPHEAIWDGRDDAGRAAPAGVYLVRLESDGMVASRRIVRLR